MNFASNQLVHSSQKVEGKCIPIRCQQITAYFPGTKINLLIKPSFQVITVLATPVLDPSVYFSNGQMNEDIYIHKASILKENISNGM